MISTSHAFGTGAAVPPPGANDDRLLLLLRIRALLEDCNRQDGDGHGRLTDIEGLLTSYMRMEEAGRAAGAAGGAAAPADAANRKRSAGEALDQQQGTEGDEADDAHVDRVVNPDWESMPGTCNPNTEKVLWSVHEEGGRVQRVYSFSYTWHHQWRWREGGMCQGVFIGASFTRSHAHPSARTHCVVPHRHSHQHTSCSNTGKDIPSAPASG